MEPRENSAESAGRPRQSSALSNQNRSPKRNAAQSLRNETIRETDEAFEQTGGNIYDQLIQQPPPKMTKTRQQEWEEAVELDRQLEHERRDQSQKRMQAQTDLKYNEYLERTKNPSALRQYSSGVGGLLGSSSGGTIKNNTISLPDLMQNKRESKLNAC